LHFLTDQGRTSVTLDVGDGVVFRGHDLPHWRESAPEPGLALDTRLLHYVPNRFTCALDSRAFCLWDGADDESPPARDESATTETGAPEEIRTPDLCLRRARLTIQADGAGAGCGHLPSVKRSPVAKYRIPHSAFRDVADPCYVSRNTTMQRRT